jgi:hypothetical protein
MIAYKNIRFTIESLTEHLSGAGYIVVAVVHYCGDGGEGGGPVEGAEGGEAGFRVVGEAEGAGEEVFHNNSTHKRLHQLEAKKEQ